MDKWQREQIEKNLTELAKVTTCSAEFIDMFGNRNLLEPTHVTNFKSPGLTPTEKSEDLYKLLINQPGSFDVLLQSLEMTKQTNALKILLDCSSIFRNFGTISYDRNKVICAGCFNGVKIYHGRFGGRDVAVKLMMNADIADTRLATREVDMLRKLDSHQNILRYFTVEAVEGSIQIALELFESSLQEFDWNVNMNPVRILKQCTKGVAYLHSMNVIHTDLRPANILLKENGQVVKISNLGLAEQMFTGMNSVAVNFTINVRDQDWMAPELLRHFAGKTESPLIEASAACDVFSLGCILFFVLTKGAHPFGTPLKRKYNIYENKQQLQNSAIDSDWLQLIKKMISHAPSHRPLANQVLLHHSLTTENCTCSSSSHRETQPLPNPGVHMPQTTSSSDDSPTELSEDSDIEIINTTVIPLELEEIAESSSATVIPLELEEIAESSSAIKRSLSTESNGHPQDPRSSSRAKKQKTSLQTETVERPASLIKQVQDDRVDESGNNAIFRAVLEGKELEELKHIVENGSDVRRINNAGDSILHLAIHHKNPNVLKLLISAGADVSAKDNTEDLPIHKLIETEYSFKEKLVALCENGADIYAEDARGYTILALSALMGKEIDDVEFIISKSYGNWKRKKYDGQTILHLAVDGGNPEVVQLLIQTGIKIHVKNNNGELPVHRIGFRRQNFKETLDILLAHGTNINATRKDGNTLLGVAALVGRSKADLEYIISKGGDIKAKNLNRESVLHLAARGGNPEAIKFLIKLGASVNFKDKFGEVPLHHISLTQNEFNASLDVLLECGADINEQDQDGDTLLNWSIHHFRPKADLEYIVEKGGNWKLRNNQSECALHVAAQEGNIEAMKYLISLGESINSRDNEDQLPIHHLAYGLHNVKESLNVLLEHGACINAADKDGDNLIILAAWQGKSTEVLEYIIEKGGDWKKRNESGQTILHMSAMRGNLEAIKYFIQLGVKVNQRDNGGDTPMHLVASAEQNFKECVQVLLEHGSKINAKNKDKHTLLDLAVMERREKDDLDYIVSKGGIGERYDGTSN